MVFPGKGRERHDSRGKGGESRKEKEGKGGKELEKGKEREGGKDAWGREGKRERQNVGNVPFCKPDMHICQNAPTPLILSLISINKE